MISLVMAACRTLFMYRVRREIISPALRVAESMAAMRAPCSAACDSRSARHTCTSTWRGRMRSKISPGPGS